MKPLFLLSAMLITASQLSFAQNNSFPPSDNCGIGTVNPTSYEHGGNNRFLEIHNSGTSMHSQSHVILSTASTLPGSSIGSLSWVMPNSQIGNKGVSLIGSGISDDSNPLHPSAYIFLYTRSTSDDAWKERMRIQSNGNVGIGTVTPDARLTVAGKIHSQEVKVTVNAGADFVFNEDYRLKDLAALEKYVVENRHLPGIASEAQMKKDGVELGEMNIRLLQKVEELTLYLIDQNKKLEEQGLQLKEQSREIQLLKSRHRGR